MKFPEYPTPWQTKTIWAALTTLSVVGIGAIAVGLIWLMSRVLGFLQPILIPFAVAAVMAYLLDPAVTKISSWGTSRTRAVFAVFAALTLMIAGILLWIVPALSAQTANLARKVPHYTLQVKTLVLDFAQDVHVKYGIKLLPEFPTVDSAAIDGVAPLKLTPPDAPPAPAPPADGRNVKLAPPGAPTVQPLEKSAAVSEATGVKLPAAGADAEVQYDLQQFLNGDWAQTTLPAVLRSSWRFITTSVGGFLGVFGFLLSMVIVPIYLYYFLIESRNISDSWGNYLPLRASAFKD